VFYRPGWVELLFILGFRAGLFPELATDVL